MSDCWKCGKPIGESMGLAPYCKNPDCIIGRPGQPPRPSGEEEARAWLPRCMYCGDSIHFMWGDLRWRHDSSLQFECDHGTATPKHEWSLENLNGSDPHMVRKDGLKVSLRFSLSGEGYWRNQTSEDKSIALEIVRRMNEPDAAHLRQQQKEQDARIAHAYALNCFDPPDEELADAIAAAIRSQE